MISIETLIDLKNFFEDNLDQTIKTISKNDSERLLKNKIEGFLISLQDKIFELNPQLKCSCGGARDIHEEFLCRVKSTERSGVIKHIDELTPVSEHSLNFNTY